MCASGAGARSRTSGRANAATHATFQQIVLGGARCTLGMPSFAKDISSDQVRLIQAYVLDQTRQASAVSVPTLRHRATKVFAVVKGLVGAGH